MLFCLNKIDKMFLIGFPNEDTFKNDNRFLFIVAFSVFTRQKRDWNLPDVLSAKNKQNNDIKGL